MGGVFGHLEIILSKFLSLPYHSLLFSLFFPPVPLFNSYLSSFFSLIIIFVLYTHASLLSPPSFPHFPLLLPSVSPLPFFSLLPSCLPFLLTSLSSLPSSFHFPFSLPLFSAPLPFSLSPFPSFLVSFYLLHLSFSLTPPSPSLPPSPSPPSLPPSPPPPPPPPPPPQ